MATTTATTTGQSGSRVVWGEAPSRRKVVGRMGPWQLVRLLAESTLNRVYLARPQETPDAPPMYAVKALRREWWNDTAAVETLRREALVGGKVSHPHVAPVLSSQLTRPPFFIVMPRVAGETLAAKLAEGRQPALPAALWIARQVAEALAAIHKAAGMIHADVKPANVFVSPDGHATLLDLGFCQTSDEARSWATRPVVGTPHYMAPEMVTSACTVDRRTDLYSLGVMLYETLTGERPFEADDPAELISMHRQAKPKCLRDARPGTPKPVASLVHRLLAKDPLRRPSTPEEVADELARLEIASFAER
ncbi:MAG: serine/threonine-protein kinase [Planctomycetota bacterium]